MRLYILIILTIVSKVLFGQPETIGLLKHSDKAVDGFNLLTPLFYTEAYLIDNCGKKIHQWQLNQRPGAATYLMPNGDLLTSGWDSETFFKVGGVGGYLERLNWNSEVLWSIKISNELEALHHDFYELENGNILVTVWERIEPNEVLAAGRNPDKYSDEIFSEKIVEIKPIGVNDYEVVWEWRVWDHLVQNYLPSLDNYGDPTLELGKFDINYDSDLANGRNWNHINSMDYDVENDLILLSSRHFNEIWVIDHSTNSEEVKGSEGGNFNRGGELLYRWGNPRTYNADLDNQILFGQHNAQWIKENGELNIMLFNNGFNRAPSKSVVEIINTSFDSKSGFLIDSNNQFLPLVSEVIYDSSIPDFYSSITSSAQLLSDSNILITLGSSGHSYEIDLFTSEVIWEYVNPVTGFGPQKQGNNVVSPDPRLSNTVFKIWRYDYSYLTNSTISFIDQPEPVELMDVVDLCLITSVEDVLENEEVRFTYDSNFEKIRLINLSSIMGKGVVVYDIYNMQGAKVVTGSTDGEIDISLLKEGIYILSIESFMRDRLSFRFIKR